jgi:ribosomal protein S18 acetylase RimI-like enzyme
VDPGAAGRRRRTNLVLRTDSPPLIRPATLADRAALGRLGAVLVRAHHELDPGRFIPPGPDTERGYGAWLVSQLDRPDAFVLAAELDEQVVGYAYAGLEGMDYMALRGPAGALYDIVVDPARRRGGIGRALLAAALAELRARGAPQVVLSTAEGNVAAQSLFRGFGFRPTMREMTLSAPPSSPGSPA